MRNLSPVAQAVADLRNAFDRSYSLPPSPDTEQIENLLAIRLAGNPFAIRVTEITGLARDRKTVSIPSPISELLGIAGIRGALVPVYSLAALLGYARDATQPRWLALCGTEDQVALGFSDMEGYVRLSVGQMCPASQDNIASGLVKDVARVGDMVRSVLSIPSLEKMIRRRCTDNHVSSKRR